MKTSSVDSGLHMCIHGQEHLHMYVHIHRYSTLPYYHHHHHQRQQQKPYLEVELS